jgi:hypothetical protein
MGLLSLIYNGEELKSKHLGPFGQIGFVVVVVSLVKASTAHVTGIFTIKTLSKQMRLKWLEAFPSKSYQLSAKIIFSMKHCSLLQNSINVYTEKEFITTSKCS